MAGDVYVIDIETVGAPWSSLDEKTREYLLGRARTDGEKEAVPRRLGLSPGTGRIIVIGMLNVSNGKGGVFVEGRNKGWVDSGPEGFVRYDGDEKEMLEEFWRMLGSNARRIVTFNGRGFDGPYLMIRSALHGVRPSMNLVGYRFALDPHCDLAEVISFFGATRQNFSLDYWCRRFGITSPKEEGLDGSLVQNYYEDGRLDEIVDYCVRDVIATAALYERLESTLVPVLGAKGRG
jgi:DNA polymerase elongation subunit (family B)